MKVAKWIVAIAVILLVSGYFIGNKIVRRKVEAALRALPPSISVSYARITPNLLQAAVMIDSLVIRLPAGAPAHSISIGRIDATGIGFWTLMRQHRLELTTLDLEDCTVELDDHFTQDKSTLPKIDAPFDSMWIAKAICRGLKVVTPKNTLSMEGDLEIEELNKGRVGWAIKDIHATISHLHYLMEDAYEIVKVQHLVIDSKKRLFRLDTLRIMPSLDKLAIGRAEGHQSDVVDATSEDISAEDLDVKALLDKQLLADKITIAKSHIYVFRDRRLPLKPGVKPLPMQSLKDLPMSIRVAKIRLGPTHFTYEEYPQKGDSTGALQIYRFSASVTPLINRPAPGDSPYLTMTSEGSLMNSGLVTATLRIPLNPDDPYIAEGAFHDLDVTRLNPPAEHLGHLHLESGLLNHLDFRFTMTQERSNGEIIGEYHDLVVDKLKDNGKLAGLKTFMLKKFIIPRNKDKRLPVKKRTGKVDYRHDRDRYFSYYLLHSLLVGIKKSFSLGFLLPG